VAGYNFENRDPTASLMVVELRKEQSIEDVRQIFVKTLEGFATNPATNEELARAKSKMLKDIDLTINSSVNLALRLSEAVGAGDWRLFFLQRDRLRAASLADLQVAALKYLKPSNRTLGLFVPNAKPTRTEVPNVPDVGAVVKNYKGDPPIAIGEAFDATPENIEKRVKRGELPGGMKTAYLTKKTRGETVDAQIILRFGDETNLLGKRTAAEMVGGMLMRGTKNKTREQLREEIDKLKANISLGSNATGAYVTISAKRDTLTATLRLAAEMLRESSLPEKEFGLLKEEQRAELERALSDPESRANEAMSLHFNIYPEGDVRRAVGLQDSIVAISAVTLDDAKAFYRDFFGTNNAQIAIVGDFDEAKTNSEVVQLFGNWQSPKSFKRLVAQFRAVPPAAKVIQTPDKESATFLARTNIALSENDPDYAAMKIADWMLGGGADFAARLVARIRVKEGLSYSVYSSLDANAFESAGSWFAYAQYAPQGKARVEAAFRDEMSALLNAGFTSAEVASAKSGYAQVQQLNRSSDASLAQTLAQHLYRGRTFAWDAALDKRVQALKPIEVLAAMKKYFDLANFAVVNAGDFAKADAK
jgi:zinc protease